MKRLINTIIFIWVFLGLMQAQSPLDNYLKIAAENNPGLKARFNEYRAALEKVPQVGALPDPNLMFGYFIQPIETKLGPQRAKISASQMFPWFGTLSERENSAEAMAKASYEMFEEAKSKLFYDVKATYYNLYFNAKAISVTLENIEILSSLKGLTDIKVESGSASAIDAYRVQMEINDMENQLALLKDNAQVLKVKFNALLNVDEKSDVQVVDELTSSELLNKQTEIDSLLVNNNVLSSFAHQLDELDYRKKAATKEGLPQFSVGLEYAFIGKGDNTMANAGKDAFVFPTVGISIPLYRNKYKAKVQEVIYLQEAKGFEKKQKENSIIVLFEEAWKDYKDAGRRLVLFNEQTELAQKSLSILESKYATSHIDFEELLRMERKLLKYNLEMQKARVDKETAIAFIRYLQGQ